MSTVETLLEGLPVAPGIAIGRVYMVDWKSSLATVEPREIPEADLEDEVRRFLTAVDISRNQLQKIRKQVAEAIDERHAEIFGAQATFLDDDALIAGTVGDIRRERRNADYLFQRRVGEFIEILSSYEDEFFKARNSDVLDVTSRVLANLGHRAETSGRRSLPPDSVLVATDLAPSETTPLFRQTVIALALEKGGPTSHTAIMAKALGIPAVVGVSGLTTRTYSGIRVIIDGSNGHVILHPSEETLTRYLKEQRAWLAQLKELEALRDQPAISPDGTKIELRANVELPIEVEHIAGHGACGIGLFRTEFIFMNREEPPGEEEQYSIYRKVVEQVSPEPTTFRTLDFGADKLAFAGHSGEANPFMGLRAIRLCLAKRDVFRRQLFALLRASAHGPVRILIPMISGLEELQAVRREVRECQKELKARGVAFAAHVPIGVMIEVPGAAVLAEHLARESDFFSIGSNDLVQYTLAVDRGNESVAYLFEPWHPAVVRLIHMTIQAARDRGIPCSVCGEVAADPSFATLLLGMGVDELSMAATCIPQVKRLIRLVPRSVAEQLVKDVMHEGTVDGIRKAVNRRLEPYTKLNKRSSQVTPPGA